MSPVARVGEGSRDHVALLLDEMHSPAVAQALRTRGHDVMAVAEATELRAMSDDEVFVWAAERSLTIVTENVKDFRRLMLRAEEAGLPRARLLFTSSRRFPRSRRNQGHRSPRWQPGCPGQIRPPVLLRTGCGPPDPDLRRASTTAGDTQLPNAYAASSNPASRISRTARQASGPTHRRPRLTEHA